MEFTDKEFEYLQKLIIVMKPVAIALDRLQGETYYGELLPTIFQIKKDLSIISSTSLVFFKEVILDLSHSIDIRFKELLDFSTEKSKTAVLAACSHPRFKLDWLEEFDDDKISSIKENFLNELLVMHKSELTNPVEKRMYIDVKEMLKLEMNLYFDERSTSFDVLNKFNYIKGIFLKFNTHLCSSAAVERVFSIGGGIFTPRRCSLTDGMFEALITLKSNKKYCT